MQARSSKKFVEFRIFGEPANGTGTIIVGSSKVTLPAAQFIHLVTQSAYVFDEQAALSSQIEFTKVNLNYTNDNLTLTGLTAPTTYANLYQNPVTAVLAPRICKLRSKTKVKSTSCTGTFNTGAMIFEKRFKMNKEYKDLLAIYDAFLEPEDKIAAALTACCSLKKRMN